MSEDARQQHRAPESPPGMPRWVKVFALVVGVIVLLAIAVMLLSGGEHGPGRHADAQPAAVHHGYSSAVDDAGPR